MIDTAAPDAVVFRLPTRRVSFGLAGLTAQTLHPNRDGYGHELRSLLKYASVAEEEQFDAVWTCEHHFAKDGYLPAPFVVLGALSQTTEHVAIGTNIMLPALWDPLRLAEEAAAVDQLCNGRLILGFGLGYRDDEFEALGFRRSDRAKRTIECIHLLRKAWQGMGLDGMGLLEDGKSIVVSPLPFQESGPPIWLGGFVETGVRRARQIADGHIAPWITLNGLNRRIDWLSEEGPLDDFDFALSLAVFCAPEKAWDISRDGIDHIETQHREWMIASGDFPQLKDRAWDVSGPPDHMVVGTPVECITRLRPWFDRLNDLSAVARHVHIAVRLTFPGVSVEDNTTSIRLFAREVIPALRESATKSPAA